MNCKPGDIAIVIESAAGNVGRFVKVIRWIGPGELRQSGGDANACAGWLVEAEDLKRTTLFGGVQRGDVGVFPDHCLRPIRSPDNQASRGAARRDAFDA